MSTGTGKGATSPPWSANDPVRADGSTIIYYSCFDGDGKKCLTLLLAIRLGKN